MLPHEFQFIKILKGMNKNEPKKGAFYEAFFNAAKALLKTMSKTARRSFGRTWISQLLNIYAA